MSSAPNDTDESPAAINEQVGRYNDVGRHEDAERILRRGLHRHPDHVNLLNKLAWTLFCQQRHDEVLEVTERALALAPDEPVLYFRRCWAMYRLDRDDEAIDLARRGLELDPKPELRLYLYQALCRFHNWNKQFAEAFAIAEQGLADMPGDAELLDSAAEALRRRQRYHEADEYYRAAIVADPHLGRAWYGKGLNDMNLGRARESLARFEQSMAMAPDNAWRAARVRYFMSWPIAGYAAAFRWSVPLASVAALLAPTSAAWWWAGLGLLAVTFGYAAHWLFRGGRLAWTALARMRPVEKLGMALPVVSSHTGIAGVVTSLITGVAVWAWLGLAAGLLIWFSLGFDGTLDPDHNRERSMPRRILGSTRWWFVDDFTGHPKELWTRMSYRWRRRDPVS